MKKIYLTMMCLSLLGGVSSCIDDKYDLDDIDTTTAIKINGLTVPVKLSEITLDQVLDVDDEGSIISIVDGYYAIQKGGEFSAGTFNLEPLVSKNGPNGINPIRFGTITVPAGGTAALPAEQNVTFTYHLSNVDKAVQEVKSMRLSKPMIIDLTFEGMADANISNLGIYIPNMFEVSNYPVENNILKVEKMKQNGDGTLSLPEPIEVNYLDINTLVEINPNTGGREMTFYDEIGIVEGTVTGGSNSSSVMPVAQFEMSGFTANRITAVIDYSVNNPEIPDVDLGDIPDFLASSDTNIELVNPQLYIWISNPTELPIASELTIYPNREGEASTYIDTELTFNRVAALAPDPSAQNLALYDEYAALSDGTLTPLPFEGLKGILAGKGIPTSLRVTLEETNINGLLEDFTLAEDNGNEIFYDLKGKYTFFTPLAFASGSQIIYQKKETDFFGDDMEDVKVSLFQVTTYPKTNLPFGVELTLYPLDKQGNRIFNGGEVVSTSGHVEANANGTQALELKIDKEFTGLDGLEYVVTVKDLQGEPLTPDQFIELTNIKAKLSGEYVTKL